MCEAKLPAVRVKLHHTSGVKFLRQIVPEGHSWTDDQSAHFVVSKSPLMPQIQTQELSHQKRKRQIPGVLLQARADEGKSLFQQPLMMISHNLGDRLHIGQTPRHPQRERRPTVPAAHTEQIDCVSCRDLGEIFDVCMAIMWTHRHEKHSRAAALERSLIQISMRGDHLAL